VKHFKAKEFTCCGVPVLEKMDSLFLAMLDEAREKAGVPFRLTSTYRDPQYNAQVGGKADSAHTKGMAADIEANGSRMRFKIVKGLLEAGFTRIGIGGNFIHCDNDPSKDQEVVWLYE
jgi:zinc D-Ala-D-Ala carboxypeptidase